MKTEQAYSTDITYCDRPVAKKGGSEAASSFRFGFDFLFERQLFAAGFPDQVTSATKGTAWAAPCGQHAH